MSNTAVSKLAKLLRMPDENVLAVLLEKMEKLTGKKGVADKIYAENQAIVSQKLKDLGIIEEKADAQYVETEILKKIQEADESFFNFLGQPDYSSSGNCAKMIQALKDTKPGEESGFFLKEEKLRNLLFLNPPQNILKALGYKNITEALEKENFYHLFAGLRFVESERWLNKFFLRPYHDLVGNSFEEREIKIEVLPEKWGKIGAEFVGKKLHHISHLKEIGFIFIIPAVRERYLGQTLENFTLLMHYLYEIEFYSNLLRKSAVAPEFGLRLVKLLSSEVSSFPLPQENVSWRIVPRYLAKMNDSDPRLFEPHINPEPLHWLKAENDIDRLAEKNPQIKLGFWRGIDDFAGEIFPAGKRGEDIVSFDLIDNIIFLARGGVGKYLYHQQEALWNKIFIEFMGQERLEELLMENLLKGYVELK